MSTVTECPTCHSPVPTSYLLTNGVPCADPWHPPHPGLSEFGAALDADLVGTVPPEIVAGGPFAILGWHTHRRQQQLSGAVTVGSMAPSITTMVGADGEETPVARVPLRDEYPAPEPTEPELPLALRLKGGEYLLRKDDPDLTNWVRVTGVDSRGAYIESTRHIDTYLYADELNHLWFQPPRLSAKVKAGSVIQWCDPDTHPPETIIGRARRRGEDPRCWVLTSLSDDGEHNILVSDSSLDEPGMWTLVHDPRPFAEQLAPGNRVKTNGVGSDYAYTIESRLDDGWRLAEGGILWDHQLNSGIWELVE